MSAPTITSTSTSTSPSPPTEPPHYHPPPHPSLLLLEMLTHILIDLDVPTLLLSQRVSSLVAQIVKPPLPITPLPASAKC
ncbi:uncharacterized protein EAF01_011863 [Botrytis porri]|uniref:uncharacterized protein n=1 Tax=Botrytis porri TaxID=87229 RepID=UPI0019029DCC|nr:uncharacterized protein EAF01_011863 [Botrytis porri]KAF7881352.1 hypothetical protein EAF01_011863 [Botrytis porri]